MKKIILITAILLMCILQYAQNLDIETVMEIQAEREMANWIESMLYPIVGDNVAIVDMTLQYPSEKLKVFGSTLDTERSLPGLPVARSSGVLPSEIAGEETFPTIVVNKVVTIYLSKTTTAEIEEFVRQNVVSWVNIKEERGDKLEVKRVLELKADEGIGAGETIIQTHDYRNYILLIGAVLLLLIFLFLIVFSSRMSKLSKSLKEVNIPGLENAFRPAAAPQVSVAKQDNASKEPISVRLLPQEDNKEEAVSFKFIENLSIEGCQNLFASEHLENIAFVLSQLSPQYVSRFMDSLKDKADQLILAVIKGRQLTRNEIVKLHQKLRKSYDEILEKENLIYDNKSLLTGLINSLPTNSSENLYNRVQNLDSGFARIMRKDVFLIEDIANLESAQIEFLIRNINRETLINYLSFAPEVIKVKFFNNMTSRNRSIFEDELSSLTPLDKDEITAAKDEMLSSARNLLLMA
jgi:hypothetical protein